MFARDFAFSFFFLSFFFYLFYVFLFVRMKLIIIIEFESIVSLFAHVACSRETVAWNSITARYFLLSFCRVAVYVCDLIINTMDEEFVCRL